jgi:hypothetical protein
MDPNCQITFLGGLNCCSAVQCAKALVEEVFLRYGMPRKMISDNGVQFISAVMQQVCKVLSIYQSLFTI